MAIHPFFRPFRLYSNHAAVDPGRPGRLERGRPRRLAAVRLPRVEPDRAAPGRASTSGTKTTRRWYYVIPAAGEPRKLVHAIEPYNLDHVPGGKTIYSQRDTLASGLKQRARRPEADRDGVLPRQQHSVHLPGRRRHRRSGPRAGRSTSPPPAISSSGSKRSGRTRRSQTHRAASERLYRIKDRAFELVRDGRRAGRGAHRARRAARDDRLVRGRGAHRRQPAGRRRAGKRRRPALRADRDRSTGRSATTRSCCSICGASCRSRGRSTPTSPGWALQARRSRTDTSRHSTPRATAAMPRSRWSRTRSPKGASCAGSKSTARAGRCSKRPASAPQFVHRTGHSLGTEVHGNGVHMDDFETHDERRLIPGTGFTIEPGVYSNGVRRPHRDQHVRRRSRSDGHRAAADRIRSAVSGKLEAAKLALTRSPIMSTGKTSAFYVVLIAVAGMAVGMVISSRLDLAPASSAQTVVGARRSTARRSADRSTRRRSATSRS